MNPNGSERTTEPNTEVASPHLTEHEAAAWLRRSIHTLRRWRAEGKGPRYMKMPGRSRGRTGKGGHVAYRRDDLIAFTNDITVETHNAGDDGEVKNE